MGMNNKKDPKSSEIVRAEMIFTTLSYNKSVVITDENGESPTPPVPDPVESEITRYKKKTKSGYSKTVSTTEDSMEKEKNITMWHSGIFGLVVGDALGVPVQFMSEKQINNSHEGPVTEMRGGGVYNKPAGTWSDDSAMVLATLHSMRNNIGNLPDIVGKHVYNIEVERDGQTYTDFVIE